MATLIIDSTSLQGNALPTLDSGAAIYIMGIVKKVLREMGKSKTEIEEAVERMKSGDYNDLCETANSVTNGFVEVV